MLIFEDSGNPFDDIAPQEQIHWNIQFLMCFVDPGSHREPHHGAVEQHSSEAHCCVGLQFFRRESLLKNPQHLAKRQDSLGNNIEA